MADWKAIAKIPTAGDRLTKRLAGESRARAAACRRDHFGTWRVLVRYANYSAFNGYHRTPSDYSSLRCGTCGRCWRTSAGYVGQVPDAEPRHCSIGRGRCDRGCNAQCYRGGLAAALSPADAHERATSGREL
jgi:hypothetical protein